MVEYKEPTVYKVALKKTRFLRKGVLVVHINSYRYVDSLLDDMSFAAYIVVDGVKKDGSIRMPPIKSKFRHSKFVTALKRTYP